MDNEVLKVIRERRSIRAFTAKEVSEADLNAILTAGTYAPSGRGKQSPVIVAVRDRKTRDELARLNAAVLGTDTDPYYGAPVILLVLADATVGTWVEDGSCVLENLMLAATSLQLGSIWIHREREIFDGEAGKALLKRWGLSDHLRGVGAVALGYPAAAPKEAAPRKKDYIIKI